jgi:hypothetical protein
VDKNSKLFSRIEGFWAENLRDVVGRICPECHSSSGRIKKEERGEERREEENGGRKTEGGRWKAEGRSPMMGERQWVSHATGGSTKRQKKL